MFEKIVVDFLRQKHGKARFPITTEDITVLIEQKVSDLDQYADLSAYGANVEGVTEFSRHGKPKVLISEIGSKNSCMNYRRSVNVRSSDSSFITSLWHALWDFSSTQVK